MVTQGNSLIQKFVFVLTLLLVFTPNVQLLAQQQGANKPEDVFEMPLEKLMEIEVVSTATLTETKPRLVPSAMTTITQEQIQASGARSLYELLDIYVPNLQWMRHHWEADVMGLRGIISDRNDKYLLLVNGRAMNERTHFGVVSEQDLVLLTDIHHIDIVRGPGSALYGPGAVSMVINIVTQNAETFQGTEITSRLGAVEEFYSTEIKHGQKFKDGDGGFFIYSGIGKYVGASKYDAPQIYPFTFPSQSSSKWSPAYTGPPPGSFPGEGTQAGEPMTSPPISRDGASSRDKPPIKLYGQIKKGNWDIWGRYTRGGKEFVWSTISMARPRWGFAENGWWGWTGTTQTEPSNRNPYFYGYQQATAYVGYKQEIAENLAIDYAFSYDMFDFERFFHNRAQDAYREDEYYGKALLRWQPNDKHKIAFGAEISHLELGITSKGWPNERAISSRLGSPMPRWSTNLYSLLGEWQWNINDQWTTFVGARLDDHTYTEEMFSPRMALVHTPTDKDTLKLMWSRSVRASYEEEMRAQDKAGGGKSDPEKLDSMELRYERQHNKNLDLAASAFVHYNLHAISWNEGTHTSGLAGTQREYGFELEASYHTEKTRLTVSHGYTKLYDFYLEADRRTSLPDPPATYITAEPYGVGKDLTNWANHITKLTAQHKLNDKWTLDASLRIYWGFPGMKDFDKYYPYCGSTGADTRAYAPFTSWPIIEDGWERAYRGNYYLDIGLQYKPSDNLTIGITGYNLLGIFNKDFNKRNYLETKGAGDFRSHAPAIGVSLLYKF